MEPHFGTPALQKLSAAEAGRCSVGRCRIVTFEKHVQSSLLGDRKNTGNLFEEHLLKLNRDNPRCVFRGGVRNLGVELSETGPHRVFFDGVDVWCRWFVDASGRDQVLKRKLGLAERNPIRHGATFCWVDGLVNIEKITNRSYQDILCDPSRKQAGHFPFFLATNHFCAEGQWFWVIPLHNKTSLGLVYDRNVVNGEECPIPEVDRLRVPKMADVRARSAIPQGSRRGPPDRLLTRLLPDH
jgi:hypothetical protein